MCEAVSARHMQLQLMLVLLQVTPSTLSSSHSKLPLGQPLALVQQPAQSTALLLLLGASPCQCRWMQTQHTPAAALSLQRVDSTESAASQHPHSSQPQQQQQQQQEPCFGPITDLTMQPIASSSSSPVIAWHNDFVGVRHAGYADLQQALWQRSQDRAVVRGQAAAAGSFSRGLMQQLGQAGGRLQPGWIPGGFSAWHRW